MATMLTRSPPERSKVLANECRGISVFDSLNDPKFSKFLSEVADEIDRLRVELHEARNNLEQSEARVRELEEAAKAIHDDLLDRAEIDPDDGGKIVDVSSGVWLQLKEALANSEKE